LYQLPGFRYARINHQVRLSTAADWAGLPTTGATPVSTYYTDYWSVYGDGLTNLSGHNFGYPAQCNIQFVYLASIPCPFINSQGYGSGYCADASGDAACYSGGCTLVNNVDLVSLGNYIAAGVKHFTDKYQLQTACPGSYSANYVELANEPNGNWDAQFTTAQYTTLVQNVHTALQALGAPYNQTKIVGAGVSNIDWSGGVDSYTNAVISNSTALASLGAFSVHEYVYATNGGQSVENIDAGSSVNGYGQTAARYYFPKWYSAPKSKAPNLPVIVTEVGTKATKFHGNTYNAPNTSYLCTDYTSKTCSIVNTTSWGVRMYTYMISLMAGGANVALYWEAQDQTWEGASGGFGMIDTNGNYKTPYYAMEPLFTYVQPNAKVLSNNSTSSSSGQPGNDIYSVVFLNPAITGTPNQQCVVLTYANGTGKSGNLSRTTKVTGLPTTAVLIPYSSTSPTTTSSSTLFAQLSGGTVYQGALTTSNPGSSLSISNGTLTHTASLANDTSLTVNACYTY
jgi:hypothetical protein